MRDHARAEFPDHRLLNHLSEDWGADFIDMGEAGHINVASGYGPWPEGRALRDLLWPLGGGMPGLTKSARFVPELHAQVFS